MARNKFGKNSFTVGRLFRLVVSAVIMAVIALIAPHHGQNACAGAPGPVLPDMMDRKTLAAIEKGLNYLAKTQRADGSWLNSGSYGFYPSVMTSLAGMAFMGGGSTPETGPYFRNVAKAMNYILRVAEANKRDGLIAGPGQEARSMYGHGFSMLFLAQCYGMSISTENEKRLHDVLTRAVMLTAKSQSDLGKNNHHAGGWYYTPESRADEGSVTVTQLQALRACRNAGIRVPMKTIERAVAYLKYCQNSDGGICYSARSRGGSRPAISVAAVACFYAAGVYDRQTGGKGSEAEMVEKLLKYVKANVGTNEQGDYMGYFYYTQFYMAQVMYQRGGDDWKAYYPKIRDWLLQRQNADGSWDGDSVGTAYGTAIATIILQLPYGYLPICQK